MMLLATCTAAAAIAPEPEVKRPVLEDDNVRVEELRVRGETQRIVVRPKGGELRPYEIVPVDANPRRPAAGQRVWQILSF